MKIRGKIVGLIAMGVMIGCMVFVVSTKDKENGYPSNMTADIENDTASSEDDDAHKSRELFICADEPLCFMLGDKKIKVEDELKLANAIMSLDWVNADSIAVTSHVNPSTSYFLVYDVKKGEFVYHAYGYDFVWKNEDIQTLAYVEGPPHFSNDDKVYHIINYNGDILYTTEDEISDLAYTDKGELSFLLNDEDNKTLREKILTE